MIRHSFGSGDNSLATDKSVSERVRMRETSPKKAAQDGIERVSVALGRVFAEVRPPNQSS
jgi:hypothetical protein